MRLRSDVPIAFSLSGGVTNMRFAKTKDIKRYSIVDNDRRYNEQKY